MSVPVLTRSYNNYRDGCYVDPDLTLTSTNVQKHGVGVVGVYYLDDPRGTEGPALVVPGVKIRSGVIRDIALIADMSGNIYGFNAHPPWNLLWKHPIGRPMVTTKREDWWGINPTWSIVGAGVVDPDTGIWYLVALDSADGTAANSHYWFHAISITDGAAAYPPLPLDGVTATGPSGAVKRFGAALRKQRAALTLTNIDGRKTVYVPFGSFAESADSNLGWIIAVDVTRTPNVRTAMATGDKHVGAGVWMGGAGLSVGDDGSLHGMTGNGGFDPPGDLGECIFKLDPDLKPLQWFSPYSDAGRAGLYPTLPTASSGMQMDMGPTNAMNSMAGMMGMGAAAPSNVRKVRDQDLGSGGPLYLPKSLTGFSRNMILGAGKDGILYGADADNMGNTMPGDFAPDKIAGNYAKLLFPPYGLTFNGMGLNLAPTQLDEIPIAVGGYTRHVHGQPVAYISPDHGPMMFVQGENGPVRAFRVNEEGPPTYLACGTEIASAGMPPSGGMPGGMLALAVTEQRANTAVLWSLMPWYGDANQRVTAGRLAAYGANWVDQNGYLIKLWDSADWSINYMHCKFNVATCQSDYLFVPSYDGRVLIFGKPH